jgi:hypothetical protein
MRACATPHGGRSAASRSSYRPVGGDAVWEAQTGPLHWNRTAGCARQHGYRRCRSVCLGQDTLHESRTYMDVIAIRGQVRAAHAVVKLGSQRSCRLHTRSIDPRPHCAQNNVEYY